jgi:hypothetical protein
MTARATPRETLAAILEYRGRDTLKATAEHAGVAFSAACNAYCARPVDTVHYLRLCIAVGFNPMPEIPADLPFFPSDFDRKLLAAGLVIRRTLNRHSLRECGDAIGIGHTTVCHIEAGDPVSISAVFGACRYIGVHPFGYLTVESAARREEVAA